MVCFGWRKPRSKLSRKGRGPKSHIGRRRRLGWKQRCDGREEAENEAETLLFGMCFRLQGRNGGRGTEVQKGALSLDGGVFRTGLVVIRPCIVCSSHCTP